MPGVLYERIALEVPDFSWTAQMPICYQGSGFDQYSRYMEACSDKVLFQTFLTRKSTK